MKAEITNTSKRVRIFQISETIVYTQYDGDTQQGWLYKIWLKNTLYLLLLQNHSLNLILIAVFINTFKSTLYRFL